MKVLVTNCSLVRNGATAEIVNIVSKAMGKEHEVKTMCIDDYTIEFCKGCRVCHTQQSVFSTMMLMSSWRNMNGQI